MSPIHSDNEYSVWCNPYPLGGASWNSTGSELWIQLDNSSYMAHMSGIIPAGYDKYKIRFWYFTDVSSNNIVDIRDGGNDEGRGPNTRVNSSTDSFPAGSSAWNWVYKEYGPYTITQKTDSTLVQTRLDHATGSTNLFGMEIVCMKI